MRRPATNAALYTCTCGQYRCRYQVSFQLRTSVAIFRSPRRMRVLGYEFLAVSLRIAIGSATRQSDAMLSHSLISAEPDLPIPRTHPLHAPASAGVLCAIGAHAQISPGPLARPHQSLSGVLNCTKCHDLGGGGVQLKCLECHTEIRERLSQRRGMHPVWMGANATSKDCVRCHSEHNGVDFQLIRWQPNREALDHRQTGYPLTGKHAELRCEQCHNAQKIPAANRNGIQIKDLNHTYLGLTQSCAGCHQDEHRGQLGVDCARCHTTSAWKPASGFSHDNAKFQLTGAHATVACAKCHCAQRGPSAVHQVHGAGFWQLLKLSCRSAQGHLQRDLPVLPQHDELDAHRATRGIRSFQDRFSTRRQTPRHRLQ